MSTACCVVMEDARRGWLSSAEHHDVRAGERYGDLEPGELRAERLAPALSTR